MDIIRGHCKYLKIKPSNPCLCCHLTFFYFMINMLLNNNQICQSYFICLCSCCPRAEDFSFLKLVLGYLNYTNNISYGCLEKSLKKALNRTSASLSLRECEKKQVTVQVTLYFHWILWATAPSKVIQGDTAHQRATSALEQKKQTRFTLFRLIDFPLWINPSKNLSLQCLRMEPTKLSE